MHPLPAREARRDVEPDRDDADVAREGGGAQRSDDGVEQLHRGRAGPGHDQAADLLDVQQQGSLQGVAHRDQGGAQGGALPGGVEVFGGDPRRQFQHVAPGGCLPTLRGLHRPVEQHLESVGADPHGQDGGLLPQPPDGDGPQVAHRGLDEPERVGAGGLLEGRLYRVYGFWAASATAADPGQLPQHHGVAYGGAGQGPVRGCHHPRLQGRSSGLGAGE